MPGYAHISHSSELSDEDLERYVLGRILAGDELIQMEEHLVGCPACAERAEAMTGSITSLIKALRQFESEDADGGALYEMPSTVPTE
jgi:anti-sigma factor RsiW